MKIRFLGALLAGVVLSTGIATADETGMKAPAAGTMRFANTPDAFPEVKDAVFTASDPLYALVGFGKPWRDHMKRANKSTSVVTMLFVGRSKKASAAFYPGEVSFAKDTYVLELLPDPKKTRQFPMAIPRALAKFPAGKHKIRVQLWSFDATTKDRVLAEGAFTFVVTADGQKRLSDLAVALKEAKAADRAAQTKPPAKKGPSVTVRRGGSDLLLFRGDEIVREGAVVGKFEGTKVRKGGSIVGEIRQRLFRNEGADAWSLDKGNLYAGTEIRWNGAIIGDIRKDGTIWWEGSSWGSVKPYGGTDAEAMRIFAALYYWSDFFKRR